MDIIPLQKRPIIETSESKQKGYDSFEKLLSALRQRAIPEEQVSSINKDIGELNAMGDSDKKWYKEMKKVRHQIVNRVSKELKLVPKHYYRNQWMALGMTIFGLPLGVAFAFAIDNMAFLAIGLPIGMPIGMAVGANLDQKAAKEGRQLDVAIGG
jgi:hypothetical protein